MSKQVKKKNIFEKIAEIDARQENEIKNFNKKSANKQSKDDTVKLSKTARTVLIVLTLSLPLLAWLFGAMMNPTGWMSDDPYIIFFVIVYMPLYLWFLSIPALILIIYLLAKRKKDIVTILVFVISLAASLYIMSATASASESEFTG